MSASQIRGSGLVTILQAENKLTWRGREVGISRTESVENQTLVLGAPKTAKVFGLVASPRRPKRDASISPMNPVTGFSHRIDTLSTIWDSTLETSAVAGFYAVPAVRRSRQD